MKTTIYIILIFLVNKEKEKICTKNLNYHDLRLFIDAILNEYWFEMYMDDLPIHGTY